MSDSCYAGLLVRERGSESVSADIERDLTNPVYFAKMLQRITRAYLASGGDVPVLDGFGGRHSVFAKNFIKVLKNNEGTIDSLEVYNKVRKAIVGLKNISQNPEYHYMDEMNHSNGEFVFTARN